MANIQLDIIRYLQDPGFCSVAASAAVTNYYDPSIDYTYTKSLCNADDGLYTPQFSILLNRLGFKKVTVVSAELNQLDFAWKKLSKKSLIKNIEHGIKRNRDKGYRDNGKSYIKFLSNTECDNNLIIDYHFGKHIRKNLLAKKPVIISFNWNLFFEYGKWDAKGRIDPVLGEFEEHAVVVSGFDDNGVSIVDSHHEMYFGRLAKYKRGRYRIDWETLHTIMGFGDLVIPDKYSSIE